MFTAAGRLLSARRGLLSRIPSFARQVESLVTRLGIQKRLIAVCAENNIESLVAYLAALAGGHSVLMLPGEGRGKGQPSSLLQRYDPDVIIRSDGKWAPEELARDPKHQLHTDLAVVLPTSGSTGSPKLVRLSHANLQANADSIASFLEITESDRAATTLPMNYSYGLSVINSHLARGASLLMTQRSVVDTCFWQTFTELGATSFAGVPHTFQLLKRSGFEAKELPSLRYVTQAGGRLDATDVQRFAELGVERGWKFYVMYGQTEATARMAYLPPERVLSNPRAIGIPIPGGEFSLDAADNELIYRGPNVMLGYASSPRDLALGKTVHELRTGDIASRDANGFYQLVGRTSRFVKPFGVRVDLDALEIWLERRGISDAVCAGNDDRIVVAVDSSADIARLVGSHLGLPVACIRVVSNDCVARLGNGKVDYATLLNQGSKQRRRLFCLPSRMKRESVNRSVEEVFASVFPNTKVSPMATFVSLGGDSLLYVEMSFVLEEHLGYLPAAWHTTTVKDLAALEPKPSSFGRSVEMSVALRAVAIVLVVSTHVGLFRISGGAHLLFALAGWNFARFYVDAAESSTKRLATMLSRVAIPAWIMLGLQTVFSNDYDVVSLLLLNNYLNFGLQSYWFIEALLQATIVLTLVLAVPPLKRLERRQPFSFPIMLMAAALVPRWFPFATGGIAVFKTHMIIWIFLLGWAAQRASTLRQRLIVSAAVLVSVPNFMGEARREAIVAVGVLLVLWVGRARLPRTVASAVKLLSAGSLYIYLTHFALYPPLLEVMPTYLVLPLCLASGILVWALAKRMQPHQIALFATKIRGLRATTRPTRRPTGPVRLPTQ